MGDEKAEKSDEARDPAKPITKDRTLLEHLKDWTPTSDDVEALSPLAKESLDRVIALTEYEDGKAGRIITAIALLSAAAGAIYAGMVKDVLSALGSFDRLLFNCGFFLYAVVDVFGVFLVLRAIYPWFNIPGYLSKESGGAVGRPKSMIFAPLIAAVSPETWVKAFTGNSAEIKVNFLKNYIHETYLIAQKIVRKYQGLRNARRFVIAANFILLPIWLTYCLYLNMKSIAHSPIKAVVAKIPAAAPDFSDYSCFVVLDADNTLWDTDRLFAEAQLAMLNDICSQIGVVPKLDDPLKFVRDIDQSIAASHPAHLKYPPELLADAVIKALLKISGRPEKSLKNKQALMKKSTEAYLSKIREVPRLRTGVQEGLRDLRRLHARAVICSEGVNESLLRNLNELGVMGYVEKVVVAPKSPEVFRQLADEFNPYRKLQLCVGDQLDRDIQNAKSAGYKTVYFPGNFRPNWLPEADSIKPDITIDSLAILPEKVRSLQRSNAARLGAGAKITRRQE